MKTGLILAAFLAGAILVPLSQAGDEKDKATGEALKAFGLSGMFEQGLVEVIGWRELAQLLPRELEGMETGKIEGGTIKMGGLPAGSVPESGSESMPMAGLAGSYSTAERTYTSTSAGGNQERLTIRLMDADLTSRFNGFTIGIVYMFKVK